MDQTGSLIPRVTMKQSCREAVKSMESAKNILLIEDDRRTSEYLSTVLRLSGHKVKCCHDGSSAIDSSDNSSYHVIITDYHMPGMNGDDVVRVLRPRFPEANIIGYSVRMVERKFLEAGADFFLPKPFQVRELLEMVQLSPAHDNP